MDFVLYSCIKSLLSLTIIHVSNSYFNPDIIRKVKRQFNFVLHLLQLSHSHTPSVHIPGKAGRRPPRSPPCFAPAPCTKFRWVFRKARRFRIPIPQKFFLRRFSKNRLPTVYTKHYAHDFANITASLYTASPFCSHLYKLYSPFTRLYGAFIEISAAVG